MTSQVETGAPVKAAVFVFFLTFYMATIPADNINPIYNDSKFMFWACQSLVEDGDVNILNQTLQYVEEHDYQGWVTTVSQYPIIPSLVGIPFYVVGKWVLRRLDQPLKHEDLFVAASLSGSLLSALTCLLLFQFTLAMGFRSRTALLSTGCYGLGTIAWPYAYYLATEPANSLAVLAAVYAAYLYKSRGRSSWLFLSGFFSGVALGSREIALLVVPPLLIYLIAAGWERAKQAPVRSKWLGVLHHVLLFSLGLVPFVLLNLWYNFARYGLMVNVDYIYHSGRTLSDIFKNPLFIGLYGLLISPGQGLFLYCPVFVLLFFSLRSFYAKHRAEFMLFISIFLIHLLVYAKCQYWHNGGGFGPRYLLPSLSLLVLMLAPFWETLSARSFPTKVLVLIVFCAGVVIESAPFWTDIIPFDAEQLSFPKRLNPIGVEGLIAYLPQSFPLFLQRKTGAQVLGQFYFMSAEVGSLRFFIFLLLASVAISTGIFLIKKARLVPSRQDLRSFAGGLTASIQARFHRWLPHKAAVAIGALGLILALAAYAALKYGLVPPLSQVNSRAFGRIEYPKIRDFDWLPVAGKLEIKGWVLDRPGIRAVEAYIDNVKVADAQYGEPSPEVHTRYPSIAGSEHARYVVTGIDTAKFNDGLHVVLIKALNRAGVWSEVSRAVLFFINEDPYDFWAHLAEVHTSEGAAVTDTVLTMNQESRRVLLQPVGCEVTFEKVPIYEEGRLKFGIGVTHEGEPPAGDNLFLSVAANNRVLFSTSIDPSAYGEDARWRDEWIDLRPFANQAIYLTLITNTSSGKATTASRIGWSDLQIIYPDRSVGVTDVQ